MDSNGIEDLRPLIDEIRIAMEATKQDIEEMRVNMATKEDLGAIKKEISDLKESNGFLKASIYEKIDEIEKKIEKNRRLTESRLANFQAVQYQALDSCRFRSKAYVEYGKPDYANYVSDDNIEPLPRYYR